MPSQGSGSPQLPQMGEHVSLGHVTALCPLEATLREQRGIRLALALCLLAWAKAEA